MDNSVVVSLRDIVVEFDGQRILDGLNLDIHDKEFVTLLGSSGCGKTTTLRLIAGFLEPNAGKVLLKGKDITGVPPYKRPVNTVFQKYALFPHLNVFENVAFGLRLKKLDEDTIRRKVRDMLEVVGLKGFERRSISQMSGGQQQRVAIARSLVNEPEILLLDEPLGALDLKLRKEMQLELKRLQREMNITFIYVTHDQEEALTMSDTVVVMNGGKVQQIGTPEDIYNEPKNAFVADFIGDSNIVDGVMHKDFLVSFSGVDFPCVDRGFAREQSVQVVVRPEDIEVVSPVEGQLVGVVNDVIFKGVHFEMHVECEGREWLIHSMKIYDKKLAYPYFVWMVLFTVVPLFIVVYYAMTDAEGNFTLNNLTSISGYGSVFARSLLLALIATVICLVIAFPVGYFLSRLRVNKQHIMLMLVMLPMWMNFLLRTYAWMGLLSVNGPVNTLLGFIGLGPYTMLNTSGAVVLGMVYNYVPYMILPLYTSMTKIDQSLVEAAQDLGANTTKTLVRVLIPMSVPGISTGITMVFVPAVSTFVISRMLGGGSNLLIGDLIEMQFLGNSYNLNVGSAMSLVLMIIVLLCMSFTSSFDEDEMEGVS